MNAGNRHRTWHKYCLDSELVEVIHFKSDKRMELRRTKDKPGYNPSMLVIVFYIKDNVDGTMSENYYSREEIISVWEKQKQDAELDWD